MFIPTTLFALSTAAATALLYRWRGGGLFALPRETATNAHTQIRRVTYALLAASLMLFASVPLWQVGVLAVVLFVAQLTGNGVPIGACGGWEQEDLEEFAPFDYLLRRLRPNRRWYLNASTVMGKVKYGPNKGDDLVHHMPHKGLCVTMPYGVVPKGNFTKGDYADKAQLRLWGMAWFALWGISLGLLLCWLTAISPWVLPLLALTGVVYRVVLGDKGGKRWGHSEYYVGALHGLVLALAFVI